MRLTLLGVKALVFYALLVLAFFAAPYTNLFFLLLAFLSVLGFFAPWWTLRALRGTTVREVSCEPAPALAGTPVRLELDGGRRLRVGLFLEVWLEGGERLSCPLPPVRGKAVCTAMLPPRGRGVWGIVRASLGTEWPVGLLVCRKAVSPPTSLVVYPKPANLCDLREGADLDESLGSLGSVGELQPSGLREYVEGDSFRRIHWKASARRVKPVVKEYEGSLASGLEVVLDRRAEGDAFEGALGVVTALALESRTRKENVRLITQGLVQTFGTKERPFAELLEFLAGAQSLGAQGPPPPPASPQVLRVVSGMLR